YARRANWWDDALSQTQSYHGADLVAEALQRLSGECASLQVLDAGCGTGSIGKLIGGRVRRLDGVDLSPEMLGRAKGKRTYDQLHEGDLVEFLAGRPDSYDAVTSAATLIHFSDLRPVLDAAAIALRDDGLFLFTLFPNEEDESAVAVASLGGLAQGG